MKIIKKLFDELIKIPIFYKLYSFRFIDLKKMKLMYNPEDLNKDYYEKIDSLSASRELEHQIGRLTNFKEIIRSCSEINGHFVEFGSWKGFSLLWIAYFMERNAIFDKKIVGIDGFIGLPYTDDGFKKGEFSNTSLKKCRRNIHRSNEIYPETKRNIKIAQYLYIQKEGILRYFQRLKIEKFSFIHIDCDVSQSAIEIFDILKEGDLIADKAYILFDDYGVENTYAQTVDKILNDMSSNWNIKEHSKTKLTKNFIFIKK